MAERTEEAEAGLDGSDDPELDAFLAEQSRLAELQAQQPGGLRQAILDHRRWEDVRALLPGLLRVMVVMVGLVVIMASAVMIRRTHDHHAAVIQPISPANTRQGLKF